MNYLQNHVWCHTSNWGESYSCRHLVSIDAYIAHSLVDWHTLVPNETRVVFDQDTFDALTSADDGVEFDEKSARRHATREATLIRDEVLEWLDQNIEDRPEVEGESSKGWAVSSIERRVASHYTLSFFFHREEDAMRFVQRFSKWGKPVHYLNYFEDIRRSLNLETLEYEDDE